MIVVTIDSISMVSEAVANACAGAAGRIAGAITADRAFSARDEGGGTGAAVCRAARVLAGSAAG